MQRCDEEEGGEEGVDLGPAGVQHGVVGDHVGGEAAPTSCRSSCSFIILTALVLSLNTKAGKRIHFEVPFLAICLFEATSS